MNRDELEGKGKDLKGKAKEELGDASGNERMKNEGRADQAEGSVQETFGTGKRKVQEGADKLTE